MLERAEALLASGRPGAVRPLLAALRRLQVEAELLPVDALEARLLQREGRHDRARALLDAAVARNPADPALRRHLAELLLAMGERAAALRQAAEAVALSPRDAAGKALLGVAMGKVGRWHEAIACLADAVAADPACVPHRLALAQALLQSGDWPAARAALADGVAAASGHPGLRSALMALLVGDGDFTAAAAFAGATRTEGAIDALLLGLHGMALSRLGDATGAVEAAQDALALAPDHPSVRHLAASLGCVAAAARAPEAFVRLMRDSAAHRSVEDAFAHGCRVPGLVRRHAALSNATGPTLDLGCGAGLLAVALSDLPLAPWRGVELSPALLAQAAVGGSYQRLDEADPIAALAQPGPGYGLILAADALCWFGDLDAVLAAIAASMADDGAVVLALEEAARPTAWQLGRSGRYAHSPACLTAAAASAGLAVRALDREVLRVEEGAPVPGLLATLAR